MHTIFAIRGIKEDVERFINELSTRYLPFKMYNFDKKKLEPKLLQLRVQPVQLYDVAFPSEYKDAVLNTIYGGTDGKGRWGKYVAILRRIFRLDPMPEYKKESKLPMEPPQNCEIVGIGVKEDYWIREDGEHVSEKDKTPNSFEGI